MGDGIYPVWAMFLNSIAELTSRKHKIFSTAEEEFRKNVERSFGILVSLFHILLVTCLLCSWEKMIKIADMIALGWTFASVSLCLPVIGSTKVSPAHHAEVLCFLLLILMLLIKSQRKELHHVFLFLYPHLALKAARD